METTNDRNKQGFRLFVLAFITIVLGVVAVGALPGTVVAEHADQTDDRIQIVDAFSDSQYQGSFGSDGNTTVAVQATTAEQVSDIQLYNGTGGVGPLTIDNGGVVEAKYDNGTPYSASDSFNSTSGNHGVVLLELNQSWKSSQLVLNASAEGLAYGSADRANRSVLTTNTYTATIEDHSGSSVTATTPAIVANGTTNTIYSDLLIQGGSESLHCGGVLDGGACTDPDTNGSAHTYPILRSTTSRGPKSLPTDPMIQAFGLASANGSSRTTLTPGASTLTLNRSTSLVVYDIKDYDGQPVSIDKIRAENRTTGNTVWKWVNGTSSLGPGKLLFLSPKTDYDVVIERSSGTVRRPTTISTKGIANAQVRIDSGQTQYGEVVGQVTNESGTPVSNATVTAEPVDTSDPFSPPPAINSTTTDENGLFAMKLPASKDIGSPYQFRLASSQTDNGTLTYFPTRVDQGGQGYGVRKDNRRILPTLEIQQGNEIDINVTDASGGPISSLVAFSSLSRTTTETGDRTRNSITEALSQFSFPDTSITQTVIRRPSPTTSLEEDVSYNVWGYQPGAGLSEVCARQTDVSSGERITSDCELEDSGTLNITLIRYESIIQKGANKSQSVGPSSYDYENVLIVRNATTDNVTTYLGPDGVQQRLVSGTNNQLSLPVPPGNYTVELRPVSQFTDRTSTRNETAVSVPKQGSGHAALESGRDFVIEPDERTDRRIRRTADDSIVVSVADPVTGEILNDTHVNVSIRLLHRNGTVAESSVPLDTYNTTNDTFENTNYRPDVSAGRYIAELRATHEAGNSTYNTTIREGVLVSDFATRLQTKRQTVKRNQSFLARIDAFNLTADPPAPISADKNNITLTVYDRDGNALDRTTSDSGISAGRGVIELPGINTTGIYRIGVVVESDDGRQGTAGTWVRISSYDLEVSTDRSVYTPDQTVKASVSLTDVNGNPISDATLETTVSSDNGTVSITNSTDTNGTATVVLDPASLFNGTDTWDRSTFARVKASIETETGIDRVRGGTGIRVRPFQARASSAQDQYRSGQEPVINVRVPPGSNVQSINATQINGKAFDPEIEATPQTSGFYQITLDSDLTAYGVDAQGRYRVEIEATNTNGRAVTDQARFTVSDANVRAEPTARSYNTAENITVNAEVRHLNGSKADGESVSMELYEGFDRSGSPDDTATSTTGSDGQVTSELSPDTGATGPHSVVVSAGGSKDVFPVLVTNITTQFTDGSGTEVDSYEFTPGQSDATINVSATNGTPIDGDMTVRALISGDPIELGSSNIVDGEGGITFPVPESANTGTYPVEVFVTSEAGSFDSATTTIELTADANTISLETDARKSVYAPGDDAQLRAVVQKGDSPANETVEFTLRSEGVDRDLGSETTGSDGTVTVEKSIPTDITDGEYRIIAEIPSEGTTAADGIKVSDIDLSVATNQSAYAAGNNVTVELNATADGSPVSDAQGEVEVRLSDGSTAGESFNGTGESSPYEVEIELNDDDAYIGSRTIEAEIDSSAGSTTASTVIDVYNASENATLSLPETIIANGTDFTVGANATVDTSATLTVFSPGTASVAYREDLSLNESASLNLSDPGTYVFELTVPGVGTEIAVRNVDSGPGDPSVYVGPSNTENATEFDTSDDIHIRTDGDDMTAEVFTPGDSFTIPLNQNGGEGSYGALPSSKTSAGPYLIRLDGPNSTDVDSVLVEVSN